MKQKKLASVLATPLGLLLILAITAATASGQQIAPEPTPNSPEPLVVGVELSPPFVMKEDDRYTGMSIELWETLAARLGRTFEYREFDTVGDLINATAANEIDVAVSNITVNEKRAQRIEFTQPWFDGGLRILVNESSQTGFWDLISGLRDSGFLHAYAWIALVIIAAAITLTLFDQRFDKDFPDRWRDGFAESFYTVMQIATTGRPAVRKNLFGWIGRIWQGLWLLCGVGVVAFITSSVTSVMTTLSLTNQIHGVDDLAGKRVGVLRDTVANDFVRESGFSHRPFRQIDDAVNALRDGSINAIVEDAPVLEYFSYAHPAIPVKTVGRIFEPDKYAFGVPHRSALRRPITIQILAAHERGEIERLRTKYFGEES